ncbi:hypothetical protein MCUN1_001049 [Malassezia cuniculi]|uniref:PHD-type domain-containing protein n=1 Tax=Malassezia cuniculi TaxID=948313 RepID=A0AAF0J573_9BASI|nr:hypothetical protein MCUN1_001049 [Malassezia cuniculi]
MNAPDASLAVDMPMPQDDEARVNGASQGALEAPQVSVLPEPPSTDADYESVMSDAEMKTESETPALFSDGTTDTAPATPSSPARTLHRRRRRNARPSQPLLSAGPPIHKAVAAAAASTASGVSASASSPASSNSTRVQQGPTLETPRTDPAETAEDLQTLGLARDQDEDDLASFNNDICETCGGHGRFLCCDGCPRSFHFACTNPPLDPDEMPFPNGTLLKNPTTSQDLRLRGRAAADDSWYCRVCFSAQKPPRAPSGTGPFGPLIAQLERENPTVFSLPAEIRNYYKGVSTDPNGTYVDSTMLRPLKLNRQGFFEQRDPHALRDKHGNTVLCYKCGGSALPSPASESDPLRTQWRAIISCDFCSLHWHLDCVDPPLSGMPSMTRKWRCPAHVDSLERKQRIPRGTHFTTVNVPLPTPGAPLEKRPQAPVEVIPDPNDKYFNVDGSGQSSNPPWEDVTVTTSAGARVRYRIPEKTIRLEFWTKAMLEKPEEHVQKLAPHIPAAQPDASELDKLVAVALRDARAPPPDAPTLREAEVLVANASAAAESLRPNVHEFAGALRSSHDPSNATPLVPGGAPDDPAHERRNAPQPPITYIYPGEIAELRAVKRLMAAKGADRLLEWLRSDP